MKNRTFACALLAGVLTPALFASDLTVQTADREVYASAFGHDWSYDDDALAQFSAPLSTGPWSQTADADLIDWWGTPVAQGIASQASDITGQELSFSLTTTAATTGNHFQEDSLAKADFDVQFDLPTVQRYRVTGQVDISLGYNAAEVRLDEVGGANLFSVSVGQVGTKSGEKFGWIAAGSYDFKGHAEASAYGSSGVSDSQAGTSTGLFQLFHPADVDLNGTVEIADAWLLYLGLVVQHPGADVNGDGLLDLADWQLFTTYYFS
jgi:hypothetical protein